MKLQVDRHGGVVLIVSVMSAYVSVRDGGRPFFELLRASPAGSLANPAEQVHRRGIRRPESASPPPPWRSRYGARRPSTCALAARWHRMRDPGYP